MYNLSEKDLTLFILIIISNISSFIQSYEIYKNKSSKNIPLDMWIISVIANILWILFVFRNNESYSILIQSCISLIGNILVIYLILLYNKTNKNT